MIELAEHTTVTLVNASASDEMVAMAAWVSHDQDSETRLENPARLEKLIDFLYRNKHMSPFEHGVFTFKVDVPLFVAREWHRHRTMSYNEVSGRYTVMKPRFFRGLRARVQRGKPGDYYFEDGGDEMTALYYASKERMVNVAWEEYEKRLEFGLCKEQAREDLPLSLMTQFYVTTNPRNLMQFLTLRNESHALLEIQDPARQIEEIFAEHMPLTYRAYAAERERERNPLILADGGKIEHVYNIAGPEGMVLPDKLRDILEKSINDSHKTGLDSHYTINITQDANTRESVATEVQAVVDRAMEDEEKERLLAEAEEDKK